MADEAEGALSMTSEAEWEEIALEELGEQGWVRTNGVDVAPGTPKGRASWADIVLPERLLDAMRTLNPDVPPSYLQQARDEILKVTSQDDITENRRIHGFLVDGYRGISYIDADGIEQNPTIRLIGHRENDNDYLAVSQVTVRSTERERRFDIVLYLNGLPVVIVELKKAGNQQATLAKAHAQLATYRDEFPTAFRCCVLTVVSDGALARYGTPFTPLNHYSPWNVDDEGRPIVHGSGLFNYDVELEYLIGRRSWVCWTRVVGLPEAGLLEARDQFRLELGDARPELLGVEVARVTQMVVMDEVLVGVEQPLHDFVHARREEEALLLPQIDELDLVGLCVDLGGDEPVHQGKVRRHVLSGSVSRVGEALGEGVHLSLPASTDTRG